MRFAPAVTALVALLAAGCGPGAGERAAVQAQDACIVALQPVADGRVPAEEELRPHLSRSRHSFTS